LTLGRVGPQAAITKTNEITNERAVVCRMAGFSTRAASGCARHAPFPGVSALG
jgi:hypothetical protein